MNDTNRWAAGIRTSTLYCVSSVLVAGALAFVRTIAADSGRGGIAMNIWIFATLAVVWGMHRWAKILLGQVGWTTAPMLVILGAGVAAAATWADQRYPAGDPTRELTGPGAAIVIVLAIVGLGAVAVVKWTSLAE